MKFIVFGLTVSSSWGNGHATLWRGLIRALAARGHRVVFFEKDAEYYRATRDLREIDGGELLLYRDFESVRTDAIRHLREADAAIVTSYCPDGAEACRLVLEAARGVRVFYDLDTPVTLASVERGETPPYVSSEGLSGFDLVLSFTGGQALELLRQRLGARRVAPLYGHVDPRLHRPAGRPRSRAALSYLGTFAADRRGAFEELFAAPARAMPEATFLLGGSQYPQGADFPPNVVHRTHVAPAEHSRFYAASRLTLNLTRGTMARLGFCPSGRLFEAAACGAPIVSDWFEGIEQFFAPGSEILIAKNREQVLDALRETDEQLDIMAARAREHVLTRHTSMRRALDLVGLIESCANGAAWTARSTACLLGRTEC